MPTAERYAERVALLVRVLPPLADEPGLGRMTPSNRTRTVERLADLLGLSHR